MRLRSLALVAACALWPRPAAAEAPYGSFGLGGTLVDRPNKVELAEARAALVARAATVRAERLAADGTASPRTPKDPPADLHGGESVAVYQQLLVQHPDDPRACKWQERVALDALAGGDLERQARELLRLRDQWWRVRASALPAPVQRACQRASEALLRPFAVVAHDAFLAEGVWVPRYRARVHDVPPSRAFTPAERVYEANLRASWGRVADTRMRLNFAGLLRERAHRVAFDVRRDAEARALLRRAAEVYGDIVATDPRRDAAEQAAYARIAMIKETYRYDELQDYAARTGVNVHSCRTDKEGICVYHQPRGAYREDPLPAPENLRPELPYSAADREMLAAFDEYVRVAPRTSPDRPRVLFLSAYLRLRRNHLDEARADFAALLRDHDGTAFSAWSAELLLGLLVARWRALDATPAQRDAAAAELATTLASLANTRALKHSHAALTREMHRVLRAALAEQRALAAHAAGIAGDRAGYVRCADIAFAAVYEADGDIGKLEPRLFDLAATCFLAAGRAARARNMRIRSLEAGDDRSVFDRSIEDHLATGRFDHTAERMVTVGYRYRGDPRAPAVLAEAHRIYLALGDAEEAASIRRIQASLRDPRQDAELAWEQLTILGRDDERRDALREFLADHRGGARDLQAVASAELGSLLWRQACPVARDHGLCADLDAPPPATCTDPGPARVVHRRDPALAGEALRHLRRAVALARGSFKDPADRGRLAEAIAMAEVHLADADLESALRRGADMRPLRRRYAALSTTLASPRWTLAARARLALASPACDAPAAARACLAHAHAFGRDDGATRLCERLSGQRHPGEFVGDAGYTTSRPESIGLQTCSEPVELYDTCVGRWLAWPAAPG